MHKEISERITILGFLMTCVVAVYHCGSPGNPINAFDMKWNAFISSIFDSLINFAMSYFFTITGFLLFHNLTLNNYFYNFYINVV